MDDGLKMNNIFFVNGRIVVETDDNPSPKCPLFFEANCYPGATGDGLSSVSTGMTKRFLRTSPHLTWCQCE